MEAYCVKCRSKREIKNPEKITMKNGKPATRVYAHRVVQRFSASGPPLKTRVFPSFLG
ncbi:MAG: hypothetical protein Ct9H300mP11_25530 [Chloroflexota bacterium]|nr:MAG: hypothetical protein Ct9H300mP11_25530 [Chloroflexota bacterium]